MWLLDINYILSLIETSYYPSNNLLILILICY